MHGIVFAVTMNSNLHREMQSTTAAVYLQDCDSWHGSGSSFVQSGLRTRAKPKSRSLQQSNPRGTSPMIGRRGLYGKIFPVK